MKTIIFLFVLATSTVYCQTDNKYIEADKQLSKLVSDKGVIGVAAAVDVGGQTNWKGSAGYMNLKEDELFSETTLTRLASIAKPMTAIAIMQLVEKKMIDLDESVNQYIPDLKEDHGKEQITVRQLLAHTSGIDTYESNKETETKKEYDSLKDAVKSFCSRDLLFIPGSSFSYSTYGYVILGRVIEEVSNLSYEDYMKENIWLPSGMLHTGVEKFDVTYENKSLLYFKEKRKTVKAKKNNLSNRIPGGGIYSNLEDMIKFGRAVLEYKLISKKSFQIMTENKFNKKEGNPYGLGWFLYGPEHNENIVVGHSGEQTGAATQIMLIPKSNTVVVVLSNTARTWKEIVTFSSELIKISEKN